MREGTVRSHDGTTIAYQVTGEGPPIVLANGVGVGYGGFRLQVEHYARTRTVLTWDYRGTHGSGSPPAGGDLSPRAHARDLEAVLEAEGVERAPIIGWSLGVQVLLELFRLDRRALTAAVAINGTCGRPFSTAFGVPGTNIPIKVFIRLTRRSHRLADGIMRTATRLPFFVPLMVAGRWFAPTCERDVILRMARDVASLDKKVYLSTLLALGTHDACDVLGNIDFPMLIVSGERDPFTPPPLARKMQRRVSGSELFEIPGGTHYTMAEFPDMLHARIDRFLSEHGV